MLLCQQVAFQDLTKIHLRPKSLITSGNAVNLRVMDDASINCAGEDGDPYGSYGNSIRCSHNPALVFQLHSLCTVTRTME